MDGACAASSRLAMRNPGALMQSMQSLKKEAFMTKSGSGSKTQSVPLILGCVLLFLGLLLSP